MSRAHAAPALLALALAAAGCGGGGGAAGSRAVATAPTASASSGRATMPFSISIPRKSAPGAARRAPRYVSAGMQSLVLYDGATTVYIGNFDPNGSPQFTDVYQSTGPTTATAAGCSSATSITCTLNVTSTAGAHAFDVVTYGDVQIASQPSPLPSSLPQSPTSRPAPQVSGSPQPSGGLILSEGELAVTLAAGPNPGQPLTLLGVADIAQWFGPQTASFDQSATIGYEIQDATSAQITTPGNYDNGPVTITASPSGILTMTPISQNAPPSATGSQTFSVTCTSASGGDVTFTASAGTQPNTAYASGLTYTPSNYSNGTLSTRTFRCFGS